MRDKDAVVASMLICEMVAFYKEQGLTLVEVLEGIYKKYGYYFASQKNFTFEGESGMKKIASILNNLRTAPPSDICGIKVSQIDDYEKSETLFTIDNSTKEILLPKSNVICFKLADGSSFIARPSGTEPKIKFYLSAVAETKEACKEKLTQLEDTCNEFIK